MHFQFAGISYQQTSHSRESLTNSPIRNSSSSSAANTIIYHFQAEDTLSASFILD
jgi:hypothetical protein